MALLPAKSDQNAREKLLEGLAEAFERGETIGDVARRMAPDDKDRRKAIRGRLRHIVKHDERLAEIIVAKSRQNLVMALPGSTAAMRRRAEKGNVPAAKLVWEASGLHNPRVKHEHSGEIVVKLDMPRPNFGQDGEITEAEVVDEPAQSGPD